MIKCKHCDNKIAQLLPKNNKEHKKHEKQNKDYFCCNGCRVAYNLINKLNLKDYYDYCKKIYNTKPMKNNELENSIDYQSFANIKYQDNNGDDKDLIYEIELIVEGIHCGSCVWLIENALQKQKDVEYARLNLSTKKLKILWRGRKNKINKLVSIINNLGYKLLPFQSNTFQNQGILQEKHLLICLAIAGFIWIQNMMLSMSIWMGSWYNDLGYYSQQFINIISAIITIPGILYAGMPFFKSAINGIKSRTSNMDIPISLGTLIILTMSFYSQFIDFINPTNTLKAALLVHGVPQQLYNSHHTYYEAASSLIFALLIGRYLEMKARNKAYSYAHSLIINQVAYASSYINGKLKLIDIKKIKPGDIILVTAGEKIPLDGVIIDGETEIDNSLITGESVPYRIGIGSDVNAGTINLQNPIKIKVQKRSEDSMINKILSLIENAEQHKNKFIKLSDQVSKYYTPIVLILSIMTILIWKFIIADVTWQTAIENGVAVLIITCPCALGLAIPVVQIIASSNLIRNGIILKSEDALEKLSKVNTIVFDKTGTLTEGKPSIINAKELNKWPNHSLKDLFVLATHSKHVFAKSLVKTVSDIRPEFNNIDTSDTKYFSSIKEEKGYGMIGKTKKSTIVLGKYELIAKTIERKASQDKDENINKNINNKTDHSEIYCAYITDQNNFITKLLLQDKLKKDTKNMMQEIRKMHFIQNLYILSGDKKSVVEKIAKELQITNYYGEFNPIEKYNFINDLAKHKHYNVLMLGDGLNDSAALKIANVSISPSSGIDITQNCADIIFTGSMKSVPITLNISRQSQKLMKQNVILAIIYNITSIPVAMFGFVTPLVAAIVMSSSSIIVILNALRLTKNKRF